MEITRKLTENIKELLEYNPATGEFFWKISGHGIYAGTRAGSIYPNFYRYIQIDGVDYRAGRLAWFFMTGEDPQVFIDHKDGIRGNDRFLNLRKATNSQNQANRGKPWTNTSGFKGVSWSAGRGKWQATITVNGKAKSLGRHLSIVDAAKAYKAAAVDAWGEFALVPTDDEIEQLGQVLEEKRRLATMKHFTP